MQRHDALKALDIYRRAGQQVSLGITVLISGARQCIGTYISYEFLQAERLSEFYEVCKSLDIGRGEKFIKIEQVDFFPLQCLPQHVAFLATIHVEVLICL